MCYTALCICSIASRYTLLAIKLPSVLDLQAVRYCSRECQASAVGRCVCLCVCKHVYLCLLLSGVGGERHLFQLLLN